LADLVGVTQPAINRYESGDRDPDAPTPTKLARVLCVTEQLLTHGNRFRGALAVDAHMRRQKTTKASVWRQMEARLNLLRVHASFLFEEVSIASEQHVPAFDPEFTAPEDAAKMVRAQWRMPMGPVVNLTRWMEAAGCLVFEEDFGTQRIDGLSQWVDDHPVVLINANSSPDRKRLTKAHELGHLVLHSNGPTEHMEDEANRFAAELMMPADEIRHELRRLELGKLRDLKREWGISMQAILERAYRLGLVTSEARTKFYKMMNARGWKTNEPDIEYIAVEKPALPVHIGNALRTRGLTDEEAARIAGYAEPSENPFRPESNRLRVV
jgi:Zn-dependent peptidase ImmA (M78 family)